MFTGKERDSESGLDYFGARFYGAALGRFTSADPDNYDARLEQPQSWNMYGYTWGNPLKYMDNDGRAVNLALAGIGAAVGFGTGFAGSAISQEIQNGKVDWGTAMAYGAGTAVAGATAGSTFGGSLLVSAVADVGVATAGNVAGGIVSRTLAGEDVLDSDSLDADATTGLVGAVVGETVGTVYKVTNLPVKPKPPYPLSSVRRTLQRNARLRKWEQTRERLEFRASAFSASVGAVVTNVAAQIRTAYDNLLNNRALDWLQLQLKSGCSDTWDPKTNTLHGCR